MNDSINYCQANSRKKMLILVFHLTQKYDILKNQCKKQNSVLGDKVIFKWFLGKKKKTFLN